MTAIKAEVQQVMGMREAFQKSCKKAFNEKLLASFREVATTIRSQMKVEERENERVLEGIRKRKPVSRLYEEAADPQAKGTSPPWSVREPSMSGLSQSMWRP